VLVLSLRRWRPWPVCLAALGLAISWNLSPLVGSFAQGARDPTASPSYWAPTIGFLRQRLTPSYRVEAVDTGGHWDAVYLPRSGIPVARGWFRQDDFPQNGLLYRRLRAPAYVAWLRSLGVRYVVLTDAPPDYSARRESALLRSGRAGLPVVFRSLHTRVFAVPKPRPIVTGPGRARVVRFTQTRLVVETASAGRYRLAVRWSPYWHVTRGCLSPRRDGMLELHVPRAGVAALSFRVNASRALSALVGDRDADCG
jgi:hypothetical protein